MSKKNVFRFLIESSKFRILTNFELPDWSNEQHVVSLVETMKYYDIPDDIIYEGITNLREANDTGLSKKAMAMKLAMKLKHKGNGYYAKEGDSSVMYKRKGDTFEKVKNSDTEKPKEKKKEPVKSKPTKDNKPEAEVQEPPTQEELNVTVIDNAPLSPVKARERADKGMIAAKLKVQGMEADKPPRLVNYSTGLVNSMESILDKMNDKMDKIDDSNSKKRINILRKELNNFINAKDKSVQISAVTALADAGVIEASVNGKKIYLSNTTLFPYKYIMPSGGDTAITREMNKIINDHKISVKYRGSASTRALADMSGKHNEVGLVYELDPSDENKKLEAKTAKVYSSLGGDIEKSKSQNKNGAKAILADIEKSFSNAKIVSARQIGGIGANELHKLGIDPKTDPTDLIVTIQTPDGYSQVLKYSAKVYTNPSNITMKNSGTLKAGTTYFGDEGKSLDELMNRLKDDYAYDDDTPIEQQNINKVEIRQQYLEKAAEIMNTLNESPDGQRILTKMWNDVHGCGSDVRTIITDTRDGNITIKSDDDYCNPRMPFKIIYDGIKVVVNMDNDTGARLQLDMKTEKNTRTKLMFRHISTQAQKTDTKKQTVVTPPKPLVPNSDKANKPTDAGSTAAVLQQNEQDWTSGMDGWEILDDDRAKVTTIRDYTDEEYKNETGEYFENDKTKKVAPNAFKDKSDMIKKMKDAKPTFLSSEEMENMGNTDVGDILSASEEGGTNSMKARGKEFADEYGKDWDRLEKAIEGGSDVPPPLVLRDKNGKLHLLAGNTRLMSFTAYGKKLPVKIIDYDGEFNDDDEETPIEESVIPQSGRSVVKKVQR